MLKLQPVVVVEKKLGMLANGSKKLGEQEARKGEDQEPEPAPAPSGGGGGGGDFTRPAPYQIHIPLPPVVISSPKGEYVFTPPKPY